MIFSIIYGDDIKIPKSVMDAMSPNRVRKQKLEVFHPFYNEKYGTCYMFDFEILGKPLVEIRNMRIRFEVSN